MLRKRAAHTYCCQDPKTKAMQQAGPIEVGALPWGKYGLAYVSFRNKW